MNSYQPTEAGKIEPGDELLAEFYDADGMAASADIPVIAVRLFARKIRVICDGATYTYPLGKILPVRAAVRVGRFGPHADSGDGQSAADYAAIEEGRI